MEVAGGERTSSATSGSAGSGSGSSARSRSAPGSRPGPSVLGHIQRGGTPTAFDRVLATRFGVGGDRRRARGRWGMMPALRGTRIELVRARRGGGRAAHGAARGVRALRKPFSASAALRWPPAPCAGRAGVGRHPTSANADATATVYVSLPLRGAGGRRRARRRRRGADGARRRRVTRPAGWRVAAEYLDDTQGAGLARPVDAGRRRRRTHAAATQDSTAIAYLGDFDSGATRSSLPVTNSARLLQVSPASSARRPGASPSRAPTRSRTASRAATGPSGG